MFAIILICIIFIIQAGFRDYEHSVNDTANYLQWYIQLQNRSLGDVLTEFSFFYDGYEDRDPGFAVFVKLTQLISTNFRFFLLLVAALISIPICRILYKLTPSVAGLFLAALVYEVLFANFFETGIRQTIAMGIVFSSFGYILEEKPVKHYLLIILAYTIHSSAVFFAPFYLLLHIKNQKLLLGGAIVFSPILMLYAKQIIAFLGAGTIYESYAVESEHNLGTPVFSLLLFVVVIVTLFNYKRIEAFYPYHRIVFSAMAMALILMPYTWVDSNFIRLIFYYLIFIMPLIPVIIENVTGRDPIIKGYTYLFTGIILILL